MGRLNDLAKVGPIDGGGSCRLALTDDDRDGRDLIVAWMRDLGLEISIAQISPVLLCQ
jgi:N-carbamoyl-L-amino-acid hydrolase